MKMDESTENELQAEEFNNVMNELKKDLEGWREVLLPLNRIINWDRPYHPAIIVGISTFIFTMIWYFEPSVLTTLSLLGLVACLIDFLVPIVGPNLLAEKQWTGVQEQQYERVCERLLHAQGHFISFKETMLQLKTEKPKVYFVLVMGMLATFAWIGSLVDNLCLTYFLVNVVLLLPGLRKHAVVQKYFNAAGALFKRFALGKASKTKKN